MHQEIATGKLAASTKLRQVEVAQRFGVSTTPEREVFGLRQSEGLLQIEVRRNT